jgi:Dockerin type I domain/PEP-CTERM motif
VRTPSLGLAGDFNGDHKVNAADYTVWRNNLGATEGSLLNNNGNGGTIDETDYAIWKAHFGQSNGAGAGGGSVAVPEPGTCLLALVALGWLAGCRRLKS